MITLRTNKPKARKKHVCNFCFGIIKKGEVYANQVNVHDNELYHWKSHKKCSLIANKLNMYDDVEGLDADSFQEFIHCEYNEINPEGKHKNFDSILNYVIDHHEIQPQKSRKDS